MLISIDGIDGCGKSTQVQALVDHLSARLVREISDSRWGLKLRALPDPTLAQQLACFIADRAGLVPLLEEAAGSQDVHIVSDRSYLSTVAYQSFDSGLAPSLLEDINRTLVPDYDAMIVLDLPVSVGLARVDGRGEARTWCEDAGRLTWARNVFLTWAAMRDNIHLIDATQPIAAVTHDVLALVERVSTQRFGRRVWR